MQFLGAIQLAPLPDSGRKGVSCHQRCTYSSPAQYVQRPASSLLLPECPKLRSLAVWTRRHGQLQCLAVITRQHVEQLQAGAATRLPRFYVQQQLAAGTLPSGLIALDEEESRHASKALRLKVGDPLEVCDGAGSCMAAAVATVDRGTVWVSATSPVVHTPWVGPRWVLAVACTSLKGGRTEWLVEKATELGAYGLIPILTARSQAGSKNKFKMRGGQGRDPDDEYAPGRLERVAIAATKQSLRQHALKLWAPTDLQQVVPAVRQSAMNLLAMAGAPSLRTQIGQGWHHIRQAQDQAALHTSPPANHAPVQQHDETTEGGYAASTQPHHNHSQHSQPAPYNQHAGKLEQQSHSTLSQAADALHEYAASQLHTGALQPDRQQHLIPCSHQTAQQTAALTCSTGAGANPSLLHYQSGTAASAGMMHQMQPSPSAAHGACTADALGLNEPDVRLLFVGPEGDFTAEELCDLMAAGAVPVGLGRLRLRTETAAVALLAAAAAMCDVSDVG